MKVVLSVIFFLLFMGCQDIFTTSAFSSLKKDTSDMTSSELISYLSQTPLSLLSDSELQSAEDSLAESRIELSENDLDNPTLVEEYLEQTKFLLDINKEQADVEGLLTSMVSEDTDEDFLTDLFEDTERLGNLQAASGYAVDAYLVDPDSLSGTDLLIGGIGLLSDILADETDSAALSGVADYETATLLAAGFTAQEASNIQTATDMLELAESNLPEDMAGILGGLLP